jgi:hypothetical protein
VWGVLLPATGLLLLLLCTAPHAGAQGTSASPPRAPATAPRVAGAPIDHALFDALLRRHVHEGLVDYDGFAQDSDFPRYLAVLERANLDQLDEDERIAFWINAYNAYTIALVNQHAERRSIRNINRTLGVLQLKGPWSEPMVKAAGKTLTLDEVFHRILRKQFREPRVHFALVAAAMGSPPLRPEAYTGAKLADQLDDQARIFLNDGVRNRWGKIAKKVIVLSPMFRYYRSDFSTSRKELGEFLAPYFTGEHKQWLETDEFSWGPTTEWDWSLNIKPAPGAKGVTPAK